MMYAIEPVDDTPEFGKVPLSVTVCVCCGHLMIVEDGLTLREPTTDELRKASKHPDVVAETRSAIN
jgi:C4-type Zn-finger protein